LLDYRGKAFCLDARRSFVSLQTNNFQHTLLAKCYQSNETVIAIDISMQFGTMLLYSILCEQSSSLCAALPEKSAKEGFYLAKNKY